MFCCGFRWVDTNRNSYLLNNLVYWVNYDLLFFGGTAKVKNIIRNFTSKMLQVRHYEFEMNENKATYEKHYNILVWKSECHY